MPTVINMGTEITLPALELRGYGLFADVVPEISIEAEGEDRTGFGAKWIGRGPYTVDLDTVDCDTEEDIEREEITLVEQSTLPFSTANMLKCSTIGGLVMSEINTMLLADEQATRSMGLMMGLTTSLSADHLNFVDESTSVGAPGTITEAMGAIEDGLGDRIANLRGHIFVPLTLLADAFDHNAVILRDGQLWSPAGHKVIADAGHVAQDTLYGTGAIAWSLTEPVLVSGHRGWIDQARNIIGGIYQRYGVIVFNPLHTVRATVS